MKLYRLYIYIDTDGDFSFKSSEEFYHETTLNLFFKNREVAGKELIKILNEIFNSLSEQTPSYFKKMFKNKLSDQEDIILSTDLDIYCNGHDGNYTINWILEEIKENEITIRDTDEKVKILMVEN